MIAALDVNLPKIMFRAEDVFDREHRRIHGVVLVVIFVHPITSNRINIRELRGCIYYSFDVNEVKNPKDNP